MLGLSRRAIEKRAFKVFYDSPTYFDIKSDAEILKKVPPFISVAHAFARKVLPVPGGPKSKIPFQGDLWPIKTSGCLIGNITASWRVFLAWSSPATSSHEMLGFYLTIAPEMSF